MNREQSDPTNQLWRWGGWNPSRSPSWPLIASPVAGDGIALVCVPKGQPVYAITTQGNGALDDHAVVWTSRGVREVTSEVPTPAYYDGDFFVLSDSRNCLSRVAACTGQVVCRSLHFFASTSGTAMKSRNTFSGSVDSSTEPPISGWSVIVPSHPASGFLGRTAAGIEANDRLAAERTAEGQKLVGPEPIRPMHELSTLPSTVETESCCSNPKKPSTLSRRLR